MSMTMCWRNNVPWFPKCNAKKASASGHFERCVWIWTTCLNVRFCICTVCSSVSLCIRMRLSREEKIWIEWMCVCVCVNVNVLCDYIENVPSFKFVCGKSAILLFFVGYNLCPTPSKALSFGRFIEINECMTRNEIHWTNECFIHVFVRKIEF